MFALTAQATGRAAAIVSYVLTERNGNKGVPSQRLREMLCSCASLLLQVQAWACAPISPSECRFALEVALQKLQPLHAKNRVLFKEVETLTQHLQAILCGVITTPTPVEAMRSSAYNGAAGS